MMYHVWRVVLRVAWYIALLIPHSNREHQQLLLSLAFRAELMILLCPALSSTVPQTGYAL